MFRFTAILKLRQQERDETAVALAKIDAEAKRLDDERQNVANQRKSLRALQRSFRSGVISAHELKRHTDFDRALRHAEEQLAEEREALEIRLQRAHDRLVAAQQEVARLEKLRELQLLQHQAKLRRREQREYDEISTARYTK